ncbi:Magnesium transporter MRS2-3 [Glycine soja]|nr:Magnesium transporter MRS2-3 [Glycine soja]
MRGGEERSTTGIRKKGSGVRQWLVLDGKGETEVVEAGKHAIMRRTGLPARDLRILDPLLSYPSTLLGRERAIVINLEHIKAIITAQELLLLNSRDPSVTPFLHELQARIIRHHNQADADPNPNPNDAIKILPFEFVSLEACLEAACSVLENEAKTLEQEAHPALDKLTSKISTLNLERVRQIKSRLVAITGRVQKVRDELEHLLDDDEDMAEMYLSEKLAEQQVLDATTIPFLPTTMIFFNLMDSASFSAVTKQLDVEELEMLLEAYFVQIDGTLNKLSTLREYVDDTEDYINIMLDDKQNHLLQMGVMLTTATLVVSAFVVVAGIFGMNIHIELFDDQKAGMTQFLWTVGGSTAGTIFLYVVAIAWCKHKRLLE